MASLTLEHVTKIYIGRKGRPPIRAVSDVSLRVADGDIIGLLGSSGCGKTSTLRMIAGLESVSEGTIRIGERAVEALPAVERNVAMAFEGYALYPPLAVAENIAFGLLRNKVPRIVAEQKVRMIAEVLEISDILDRYPPILSAGQQQRVSLARALVRTADLYLLDEPMSQLEPPLRAKLRARIKDYLIQNNMTSVFVTHDQTEAMALADGIAVMSDGVLQQFGSPVELRERPANLFVASFIGEPPMNLLDAQVIADGPAWRAIVHDARGGSAFFIDLPRGDRASPLQNGQRVLVGIRPHKIILGRSNGAAAQWVSGAVVSSQWLGDQSYLAIDVGGRLLTAVADRGAHTISDGAIPIGFPLEGLHVFDRGTGAALLHAADAARS